MEKDEDVKKALNRTTDKGAIRDTREVTWKLIFTETQVSSVLICQLCVSTNASFWTGGYLNNYLDNIGLSSDYFGWIMFGQGMFIIFTMIVITLMCNSAPRRFLLTFTIFCLSICALLIGPSSMLGIPQDSRSIPFICTGVLAQGIPYAIAMISIVPELLERLTVLLNAKSGVDTALLYTINDKANDAISLLFAVGQFIGPIIGSGLATFYNNPSKPGEIMFLFDIFVFLFIFTFNCGFSVFSENREFTEKLRSLREEVDQQKKLKLVDTSSDETLNSSDPMRDSWEQEMISTRGVDT